MLTGIAEILDSTLVVIKVGSSSITGDNADQLRAVCETVAKLRNTGIQVIVVTSGAIATGGPVIGATARTEDLATSQALAAIGQAKLMTRYQNEFDFYGLIGAQVLLTVENLDHLDSRDNALRALRRLLELGVVPVVNENDTVATQEIRFGDNDHLAATVSELVSADLLILLSDVDAIYTSPPEIEGATVIPIITEDQDLSHIAVGGTSTGFGMGGAVTKVAAARQANAAGIPVLLTSVTNAPRLTEGKITHTWFSPKN